MKLGALGEVTFVNAEELGYEFISKQKPLPKEIIEDFQEFFQKPSSKIEEDNENLLSSDLNESDIMLHPLMKKARIGGNFAYPLSEERNRVTID